MRVPCVPAACRQVTATPPPPSVATPSVDSRRVGLRLRRARLVEDSFEALANADASVWARDFYVMWHGEQGMDYGALTRELLVLGQVVG